jgi:hypothetical protein
VLALLWYFPSFSTKNMFYGKRYKNIRRCC